MKDLSIFAKMEVKSNRKIALSSLNLQLSGNKKVQKLIQKEGGKVYGNTD